MSSIAPDEVAVALINPQWARDCKHWRGHVLTGEHCHYCSEYDGLPIDETCSEWPCCIALIEKDET